MNDLENCSTGMRLLLRLLHVGTLTACLLGAGWVGWMWATGTECTWGNRTPSEYFAGKVATGDGPAKGGDLIQHYAAGALWHEGRGEDLYAGYHLGKRINQWYESRGIHSAGSHDRLNYVYSPLVAFISSWGTSLPFTQWMPIYLALSILSYLLGIWLLIRFLIPSRHLWLEGWLVACAFPSFYFTLIPFQTSTFTLLILIGAACLLKDGRHFLGGLVVSCVFYKPQLMPWLAVFLIFAGNVRAGAGIVIGSALWMGSTILLCGGGETLAWLSVLRGMTQGDQFVMQGLNQAWIGCLGEGFASAQPWSGRSGFLLGAVIFFWLAWQVRSRWKKQTGPGTLFLGCAAWTVCSTYVGYYDVLLTLPCCLGVLCVEKPEFSRLILTFLLWIFSLLSISGVATHAGSASGWNLTAPLVTCYLVGAVYLGVD